MPQSARLSQEHGQAQSNKIGLFLGIFATLEVSEIVAEVGALGCTVPCPRAPGAEGLPTTPQVCNPDCANPACPRSGRGLQRSFMDDAKRCILNRCAAGLFPSNIDFPVSSSI